MTIFEKLEAALIEFLDARERLSMVPGGLTRAMEEQPSLEEGVIRAEIQEIVDNVFNLGKE